MHPLVVSVYDEGEILHPQILLRVFFCFQKCLFSTSYLMQSNHQFFVILGYGGLSELSTVRSLKKKGLKLKGTFPFVCLALKKRIGCHLFSLQ